MADFLSQSTFDQYKAMWPDVATGKAAAPVRVGMDRQTGRMLVGWPHVVQSIQQLFQTRFHERILRQYVGCFSMHLLGENATDRLITKFYWSIATAIDLWEPCYRVQRVQVVNKATSDRSLALKATGDDLLKGNVTFAFAGIYMPRGHLGDDTPETRKSMQLIARGNGLWESAG